VQEALERYLGDEGNRRGRIEAALALGGSLNDQVAEALEESVRKIRSTWR
jgi:hypothetical protein